jgi:AraC-like DNA-binding protein
LFVKQVDHKTSELFLNRITAYIDENFHSYAFSVQGLAEHFNMSVSSISHYFRGSTGQTLSDYISKQRIQMAKKLLIDTDSNLKMIVDAVGYSDVSSFIKKFKRLVGATPGEYRRSKTEATAQLTSKK